MEKAGYDVAKIAARVQRGHDFVYDRLRLLRLTPPLRELFLADRFQLSQALVLAKLSPDEQTRAARRPSRHDDRDSGLWRAQGPTLDEKMFPLVAKTAAELEHWIATELRFDPAKVEVEELFPDTAIALEAAAETGTRVVSITREDYLRPNAKDQEERTFTRTFWKRADGLEGSKECAYGVIGIVRVGEGRGEAMGVCLRRDKCTVHWAAEVRRLTAREKAKTAGASGSPARRAKASAQRARAEARERVAKRKANVEKSRMIAAAAFIEAQLEQLIASPTAAAVEHARRCLAGDAGKDRSMEQLLVHLAIERQFHGNLAWELTNSYHAKKALKNLQAWSINAAKIIAGVHVDTCMHCGCSEENACRLGLYGGGESCHWISKTPHVCSNPKCVAAAKGQPVPAASGEDDDDEE